MSASTEKKKIHFIGIGGIGMSALARFLKAHGVKVQGSDVWQNETTRSLRNEGIRVQIGHTPKVITKKIGTVIYNRAIAKNNPELHAAEKIGIPIISYAKVVGRLTEAYRTIAITGSHGKSTTTAIAALLLIKSGYDPNVLIGTKLKEFRGKNMRTGESQYLVLEADDFGEAFLEYSPTIAIVTNIDREHLDFYKTFANLKRAFLSFLARTEHKGIFILNRDDPTLFSLRGKIAEIAKGKKVRTIWYSLKEPITTEIKKTIRIPGAHNLSNALAVYHLGKTLGITRKKTLKAISAYHGSWRRFEYRGGFRNAKVYDDYAHHPTEIRATLAAFREKFPHAKIICMFQPHQTKRLESLFSEFQSAFDLAEMTFILPTYAVAGRDKKTGKNAEALVRAMQKRKPGKSIFYIKNSKKIPETIKKMLTNSPAVIIMMGAGNINEYTNRLLRHG